VLQFCGGGGLFPFIIYGHFPLGRSRPILTQVPPTIWKLFFSRTTRGFERRRGPPPAKIPPLPATLCWVFFSADLSPLPPIEPPFLPRIDFFFVPPDKEALSLLQGDGLRSSSSPSEIFYLSPSRRLPFNDYTFPFSAGDTAMRSGAVSYAKDSLPPSRRPLFSR